MGNVFNKSSSVDAVQETTKLKKNQEKVYGTVPSQHSIQATPSSHPLIHNEVTSHPVQVEEEGKPEESKIAIPNGGTFPFQRDDKDSSKDKGGYRWCRVIFTIIFSVFSFCFTGAMIYFIFLPYNTSSYSTVQYWVDTMLKDVDPFWYKSASVTRTDDKMYDVHVSLIKCSDLTTYTNSTTGEQNGGHTANHDSFQQLEWLETYAYLVKGSCIELTITIIEPPDPLKEVFLYVFNNYDDYNSLSDVTNTHYFTRYNIKPQNGSNTTYFIKMNETSYYFYALWTPNGTAFKYSYTVHQKSYNISNINFSCVLTPENPFCSFDTKLSDCCMLHERECLVSHTIGNSESAEPFKKVKIDLTPRRLNVVAGVMMSFAIVFFLLACSVLTYNTIKFKLFPWIHLKLCSFFKSFKTRGRRRGNIINSLKYN